MNNLLNRTVLEKLAQNWGDTFPPISQVIFCQCIGYEPTYALVITVDEALWHTFFKWTASGEPWDDPPNELVEIKDFFEWQAGGESCGHIQEELAAAYLTPPNEHELPGGWIWFPQPAGAGLPELVVPGCEIVLYDRDDTASQPASEELSDAPNIFRQVGAQAWEVRFNDHPPDKPLVVTKLKGHGVLRAVLAKPHTLTTYHEIQIGLGETVKKIKQSPLEIITPENLARMKEQEQKLENRIEILEMQGESEKADTVRKGLADLKKERGKVTWQGRVKLTGEESRNKRRIDNQLKRALNDIGLRQIPGLVEHLERHVLKNRTTEGITYDGQIEWATWPVKGIGT